MLKLKASKLVVALSLAAAGLAVAVPAVQAAVIHSARSAASVVACVGGGGTTDD